MQDVCRIEEGSANAYLTKDRAIEEFLKEVEPRYNASLAKLRENKMEQEAIASLSMLLDYHRCAVQTPAQFPPPM